MGNAASPARDEAIQVTGQSAFVNLAMSVFSTTSDVALAGYVKLQSFVRDNSKLGGLLTQAQAGRLDMSADELFERVRDQMVGLNVEAVVRQVVMPLASGYVGYAAVVALGVTGSIPVLIGVLIGAIVWLAMAPGTWRTVKARIDEVVNSIFSAVTI